FFPYSLLPTPAPRLIPLSVTANCCDDTGCLLAGGVTCQANNGKRPGWYAGSPFRPGPESHPPMTLAVAVLMDPIGSIKPAKDTTLALLLEAQRRRHRLYYLQQGDLALAGGRTRARMAPLQVRDDPGDWYSLGDARWMDLAALDVLLLRKDPPFDSEYLYDTQLAELAQREGVMVVNNPQALRDANEKLFALHFPQCCPPTLVARDADLLRDFVGEHGVAVLKPLDGMGGRGVFKAGADDPNLNVILETLTNGGRTLAVAQRYLPEIRDGDKRILLVDGEPVPYALARIPQGRE